MSFLRPTIVSQSTSAAIPAATLFAAGSIAYISDINSAGSYWVSNGTLWIPLNGQVVLHSTGIPMIIPSSGSIANNGALTLTTALTVAFPACYMYFPASAIAAGSAAGIYYVTMSSTTLGTIWNNTYTSGTPTIPASPTAFATTGPLAYVQTTGALTLISIPILANSMGLNGTITVFGNFGYNNSATSKTGSILLGASQIIGTGAATTTVGFNVVGNISNAGIANVQSRSSRLVPNNTGSAVANSQVGVDTTADTTVTFTGNLAAATDFILIEQSTVILQRP